MFVRCIIASIFYLDTSICIHHHFHFGLRCKIGKPRMSAAESRAQKRPYDDGDDDNDDGGGKRPASSSSAGPLKSGEEEEEDTCWLV